MTIRSKRSWGHGPDLMALVGPSLTITPADVAADHVEVLESDGSLIGFLRLQRRSGAAWLEDLFVDPSAMGRGYGRHRFERALAVVREWGCERSEFESDPNAESFYRHLGAERIAIIDSSLVPGRCFSRMRFVLPR